jgi:hypothetical protein
MKPRLKKARRQREVPVANLRWRCAPRQLGFRDTTELPLREEIIGQPRALAALQLGLEIQSPGYNIFVVGLTGTGKTTTISRLFAELHLHGDVPPDLCYVNNFKRPEAPRALLLPAGRGRVLRQDLWDLLDFVRRSLPEVYESESYQTRHRKTIEVFKERGRAAFKEFDARVEKENFRIVQIQMGALTRAELHAVVGGEAMSMEQVKDLADDNRFDRDELRRLQGTYEKLSVPAEQLQEAGASRRTRTSPAQVDRHSPRPSSASRPGAAEK